MTNLKKLSVSLTKHGAHKLAILLQHYDSSQILNHVWGSIGGVKIERVQAAKNLSATLGGVVPPLWDEVRHNQSAINALVLIGVIFSHHQLIKAMQLAADPKKPMTGTVVRGGQLNGKAFTNFAHTIEQLGFATQHTKEVVGYDLSKLFAAKDISRPAVELLSLKLELAGWNRSNSAIDECIAMDFHKALAISDDEFRAWLTPGISGAPTDGTTSTENTGEDQDTDLGFFTDADDSPSGKPFVFKQGHNEKKTGKVSVGRSAKGTSANLVHNDIQNQLYGALVAEYGADAVGTEVDTGQGTSIDVVVKTEGTHWFYEIKTADTVKACVRQALPQLLEYAYWHGGDDRAGRLVIAAPLSITKEAETYLAFLREKFRLPIEYMEFPPKKK